MLPDLENKPNVLHGSYPGKGIVFSFEVDDSEKEYKRLKALVINITFDLKDEEWGQRHFMVTDSSGMILDIAQHLKQF